MYDVMRARPLDVVWFLAALPLAMACSQRVTPEEEFAERERERPLLSEGSPELGGPPVAGDAAPAAEGPTFPVVVESSDAGANGVLFVIVRPPGVTTGPPLAVRRVPAPEFPVELAIGPGDAMIPGTAFPDRVAIAARLDMDGDASTTGPDDLEAAGEATAAGSTTRLVLESHSP